ncbi:coiled-coil domain-containing protein 169-like [Dysidea avara]|uniref:coiled-coil domain-containing protein 169-like n=1 Tax=Dysidea avara TaxID=196820 RepID=UPI00332D407D
MTTSLDPEWDVERIRKELKREKETKLALQHAIMELEHMQNEMTHKEDNVEESEWQKRYLEQAAINSQLSQQISQLEAQLMNAREVEGEDVSFSSYQDLDNNNVRQLLKKLEREKTELEWQLRDCEWRLDQEAAAVYKAGEDRKTMMTELGQASLVFADGGKTKPKKHDSAAGSSVKQKPMTSTSPLKQVKKATTNKDSTTDQDMRTPSESTTSPVQD